MVPHASASTAPVQNVAAGPDPGQSAPASTPATRVASPEARLNTPNAVPRSSRGRYLRHHRREHALREAHVQTPERDAHTRDREIAGERQQSVGGDEAGDAAVQQHARRHAVGETADRDRRASGVHDVHRHQHERAPARSSSFRFAARSTRNASLKRASVSAAPAAVTPQNAGPREASVARSMRTGALRGALAKAPARARRTR